MIILNIKSTLDHLMDHLFRLKITETFDTDIQDDLGRALHIHESDCERVRASSHNQFQHYGGFYVE
ncbi:hypothetical protein NMY3_03023 [Candidatus Nitrosocosmicus oleophilus]|uniref:Uncharacterized protein n=1 Tax=Candidatus Nitrosocosmicus oleophilus TaxID=1353260 RepID=A0A654M2H8_9ARCH|nr:hypothetical protein NMY3_03023 [Candidatus Nitrosocosmicus oleophilus]